MHADEVHDRSHYNAPENNRIPETRPDHLIDGDMNGDHLLEAQTTTPPQVRGEVVQPINDNPGKALGIAGFVLSFTFLFIVGLILSIVALYKSTHAGHKNGFALAGVIISIFQFVAVALIIGAAILLQISSVSFGP